MYLLDTNVISELRRSRPHPAVVNWLREVSDSHLHIAAITLGELQAGVEMTREQDDSKAAAIEEWVDQVAGAFNLIAADGAIFRAWARLTHRRSNTILEDAMIAATAIVHDLIVVTRNVRDFEVLGVRILNPFERNPVVR